MRAWLGLAALSAVGCTSLAGLNDLSFNEAGGGGQGGSGQATTGATGGGQATCAVAEVELDDDFGCLRRDDGRVACWGSDGDQLGFEPAEGFASAPGEVSLMQRATDLALGQAHACALVEDGSVWCWGNNFAGQLGNGTVGGGSSLAPTRVMDLADVSAIAAGEDFTCARSEDGRLRCWGSNAQGQIGPGVEGQGEVGQPTPVEVGESVTIFATAARAACAVTVLGGTFCWGEGPAYGVPDGMSGLLEMPVAADALITAGVQHFCGASSAGAVSCWGSNGLGQLGRGTSSEFENPAPVSYDGPAPLRLSAHRSTTFLETVEGQLFAWGQNSWNDLLSDQDQELVATPIEANPAVTLSRIARGRNFGCGIDQQGRVQCWGSNCQGQLGRGTVSEVVGGGSCAGSTPAPEPLAPIADPCVP